LDVSVQSYTRRNIKNSFYDGLFAHIFATLTGGVFLTGFALYLGMTDLMIGLLGSIPFLVTVFQLPTSYVLGKDGRRKKVTYWGAAMARFSWIAILTVAFIPSLSASTKWLMILGLFFLSHSCISCSYVSWLSWISDLVPDEFRGRFFGARNMLCGAAGMLTMIFFGNILDYLKNHSPEGLSIGFSITIISAVIFGALGLRFLNRIPEPQVSRFYQGDSLGNILRRPFGERNFRHFLLFAIFWGFSVHFASPFFTLYFLRYLELSYGFVALLGTISACADLLGMQVWGRISDKVRNKAIIQLAGWVAVFLPLAWVTVRPGDFVMPVILQLMGGGFWAGINLCTNNLLLRISPQENRPFFLSVYNIVAGVGAALGPIAGGLAAKYLVDLELEFVGLKMVPLHVVFLISTALRFLSFQLFRYVHEPEEATIGQLVRVLRNVRGLNVATGFNYLLHPFIEIMREDE
jgi:MFS family permease